MTATRSEKDFLGSKDIPIDAYYGVHTARALDNFTVSGVKSSLFPRFIIALAMVINACMAANLHLAYYLQRKHRPSVKLVMKSLTASCTSILSSI